MAASPASPVIRPTAIAPISSSCAPSVRASCITCFRLWPPEGEEAVAVVPSRWRARLASSTAMTMAGDSIKAIAAAMWPPKARPWLPRYCVAVMKVTALTEP